MFGLGKRLPPDKIQTSLLLVLYLCTPIWFHTRLVRPILLHHCLRSSFDGGRFDFFRPVIALLLSVGFECSLRFIIGRECFFGMRSSLGCFLAFVDLWVRSRWSLVDCASFLLSSSLSSINGLDFRSFSSFKIRWYLRVRILCSRVEIIGPSQAILMSLCLSSYGITSLGEGSCLSAVAPGKVFTLGGLQSWHVC